MFLYHRKSSTKTMSNHSRTTKHTSSLRGFTLVEMMVSMAIFAVVAVVAATALLKIMSANKKAQSIQSAMTNLNFALESMSRELREGSRYQCGTGGGTFNGRTGMTSSSCTSVNQSNNDSYIAFKSSESSVSCSPNFNTAYVYRFIKDTNNVIHLQKAQQAASCGSASVTDSGSLNDAGFSDLVSPSEVTITNYSISEYYAPQQQYPLATINIAGYAGVREADKTYFNIQTAASSRHSN